MSMRVKCPGCGNILTFSAAFANKVGQCPQCAKKFKLPSIPPPTSNKPSEPPDEWLREPIGTRDPGVFLSRLAEEELTAQQPPTSEQQSFQHPAISQIQVAANHKHQLAGAFRTGFGIALGWYIASALVTVVGILALVGLALIALFLERRNEATVSDSRNTVAQSKEIQGETEQATERDSLLSKVRVLGANLRQYEFFGISQTVIDLKVRNDTGKPIKRIEFRGVYQTPGRSLPWVEANFSYEPEGGLEPGETQQWRLTPNPLNDFYDTKVRPSAVLKLTVTDAEFVGQRVRDSSD